MGGDGVGQVACISAIINFVYIPYYPVWSLIMLTVDAGIIWALASYRREAL